MKFSDQFIPHVIVLVLVILAVLVCFIPCVVPYSRGSSYATYEGMESEISTEDSVEAKVDMLLSDGSGNVAASSESVATPDENAQKEHFELLKGLSGIFGNTASTSESFVPLSASSGPVGTYSEIIDKFSQVTSYGTEGKNGCTSSGLSTSKGYLCLTPELITALKTRGGNAQ